MAWKSLKYLVRIVALRLTPDKRLRYASPKLPLATSFIRKTLGEIVDKLY
jgi:hypothetical protein